MNIQCILALIIAGCAALGGASAQETLDDVQRKLIATVEKHRTWRYRFENDNMLDGPRWWEHIEGTVEYERLDGGGYLYRTERRFRSYKKDDDGREHKLEGEFTAVCDGRNIYNYQVINNERRAMRLDLNAFPNPCDYRAMFEAQRAAGTMRLLPDETIDGQPTYVIESVPNDRRNSGAARTVWYFAKSHGMTIKNVTEDILGTPTVTATATDFQFDIDIPRSRFEFKAPHGVEIVDGNNPNPPPTTQPVTTQPSR
ncbi:MAG: hypothetical protein JNG88_16365 [Phycisphaerales bacterium]|nr:hypothetical protein [Phycisphaerales bacterium]